jgi:hypothetical protein
MNRAQTELVLLQFDARAGGVGTEVLRESQASAWVNLHDILIPLKGKGAAAAGQGEVRPRALRIAKSVLQ